jgi:hypothetical protein
MTIHLTPATVAIKDARATRDALWLAIDELQDRIAHAYDVADGPNNFPFAEYNYAVNALEAIEAQLAAQQEA